MGNCAKLKWNRRAKGLTQQQFADLCGVSKGTIAKLEIDETAWLTLRPDTEDKIVAQFTSPNSWKLSDKDIHRGVKEIGAELAEDSDVKVEVVAEPEAIIEKPVVVHNGLTNEDLKVITLVEFAYEGLTQATTHDEFVANINLIKRIIKAY